MFSHPLTLTRLTDFNRSQRAPPFAKAPSLYRNRLHSPQRFSNNARRGRGQRHNPAEEGAKDKRRRRPDGIRFAESETEIA